MPSAAPLFHDDEGRPAFADCAVLFLDLLGTAGPHGPDEALDQLNRTKRAVEGARTLAGKDHRETSLGQMTWFSDNLSLHYAAHDGFPDTQALGFLVTDVGYLQLSFLDEGFVARGAVTFGNFYADQDFVHGPALDRAVALEKGRARFPRVVLDEASVAIAHKGLVHEEGGSTNSPWRSQLSVEEDGTVFVDYLGTLLDDREAPDWWIGVLATHQELIQRNLRRYDGVPGVEEKYRWLASYHNDFVSRYAGYIDAESDASSHLRATCSRPLGRFTPFGDQVEPRVPEGPGGLDF